jgi:hypothetical protein
MDIPALAALLEEAAEKHHHYEETHAEHNWSDWYAAYVDARQRGDGPDEAYAAAGRYMEETHDVLPR